MDNENLPQSNGRGLRQIPLSIEMSIFARRFVPGERHSIQGFCQSQPAHVAIPRHARPTRRPVHVEGYRQ